jgi:bifunctional non-homologous end joining protein LigD
MGLEGVIGKRRGSPYVHRRSDDWIKLKCTRRQDFIIGGYTWPDNKEQAGIGALLVGHVDDAGVFQYAGKVGTGFTGEMSALLRRRLDGIVQPKRPFAGPTGHDRHATWTRPDLVCEVAFGEWPEGGSLRHASFKGLRDDHLSDNAGQPRARGIQDKVKVTHGDRVIDPSTGITKLELVTYYVAVAPWALPHLKGRHVFIRRAPHGIQGPMVFQEHPEGMRGLRGTDPALWPGHEPAISIETAEDLATAAQSGMVELHTWNSKAGAIDTPDRMMLDLDPGDGVPWRLVQEAATLVRSFLEDLGLRSWLKTSGGKGLHLAVPLKPQRDHQEVKAIARAIAEHLARTIPQRFAAKSGAKNRIGRVFVDYLRNGPAQTTAAAFSARARPGMGVSVTVGWDELEQLRGGDAWTIRTAPEFLAGRADPWADYWRTSQTLDLAGSLLLPQGAGRDR